MFQNIIFDVDGTLTDTEAIVLRSLARALREEGLEYAEQDLRFVFGIPSSVTVRQLPVKDPEALRVRWGRYEEADINDAPLFPGIPEMLAALQAAGLRLGVVTSRLRGSFAECMRRTGYGGLFCASVCCEDTARHKPCPEPMYKCLADMQANAPESLYVGDSVYDLQCAKNAGVSFALALWGAKTTEGFDRADYILDTPQALLRLLGLPEGKK